MNKCSHPESLFGWCHRTAPCLGECEWAETMSRRVNVSTDVCPHGLTYATCNKGCHPRRDPDQSIGQYNNESDWIHAKETPDTITSPCGRFEITRIRVTLLSRRYSAWDKYPTNGEWIPTLAGVFNSAKAALRCLDEVVHSDRFIGNSNPQG
jgi:hypothetical protein